VVITSAVNFAIIATAAAAIARKKIFASDALFLIFGPTHGNGMLIAA
jgi:hypothetical protein